MDSQLRFALTSEMLEWNWNCVPSFQEGSEAIVAFILFAGFPYPSHMSC